MKKPCLLLPFWLLLICACRRADPPAVSFYYWKTTLSTEDVNSQALAQFSPKTEPLYLRLFDVDYSAGYGDAVPVGEIDLSYVSIDRPIVPVVFITQRVFSQLSAAQIDTLAARVAQRINRRVYYLAQNASANTFGHDGLNSKQQDSLADDWYQRMLQEVQIDCDWTEVTRDVYFSFLKALKQQEPIRKNRLSCTIRLHQYRERSKNGVPPVERGVLMCYNVTSPRDTSARNAIFDPLLIEGYLKNQSRYPLPLDIALPVFNWGAWFRGGVFMGLLSNWEPAQTSDWYQRTGNNLFQVRQDTVLGSNYLRQGDLIRFDNAPEAEVLSVLPMLQPLLARDGRLLFFDWDSTKTKRYENLIPAAVAGF